MGQLRQPWNSLEEVQIYWLLSHVEAKRGCNISVRAHDYDEDDDQEQLLHAECPKH